MQEYIINNIIDFDPIIKDIITELPKSIKTVIYLNGDLGAGKTTFAKELLLKLGVNSNVTSPTFTIINEYVTDIYDIFHLDLYRINNSTELNELNLATLQHPRTGKSNLVIIEWADLFSNELQDIFTDFKTIDIEIEQDPNIEAKRIFRVNRK